MIWDFESQVFLLSTYYVPGTVLVAKLKILQFQWIIHICYVSRLPF